MGKRIMLRSCCVLVLSLIAATAWIFFGLFFAGTACYTEQDWLKYEFYTPELLKGIPKISDKYDFNFGNITGPEAQIFTITFSMLLKFSLSEIT